MFVCKHTKQNMIKISLNFEKNVTSRVNNLRMLRIKNDKFQSNVFIPTQKYSEIFKSALVYTTFKKAVLNFIKTINKILLTTNYTMLLLNNKIYWEKDTTLSFSQ